MKYVNPGLILAITLASMGQATYAQDTGFYGRLDTGYSWPTSAGVVDKNFAAFGGICGNARCTIPGELNNVDGSGMIGGGIGYRFSQEFRSDLTFNYRGMWSQLNDTDGSATHYTADVTSLAVMANGYFDFNVGSSTFKPYVGAGLGFAQNKIGTLTATGPGFIGVAPGGTKTDFAWSLTAGVGFKLPNALVLEVGYRYIDVGKVETDAGNIVVNGVKAGTYFGATGQGKAHELTLGIRF
jgi:opacity protein-like surface antigen